MRNVNAIGYWSSPEPPEPDRREERVSRRVEEIWANADILECVLDEAGYPLDLPTTLALADYFADPKLINAEMLARRLRKQIARVVQSAAEYDVDNSVEEP